MTRAPLITPNAFVALNPNDTPITMLTIQLLERKDDEAALRRASATQLAS